MPHHTDVRFDAGEIIDRVKMLFEFDQDAELAVLLGIGRSAVSNWRTRDQLDLDLVLRTVIAHVPNASLRWLLLGEGSRYVVIREGQELLLATELSGEDLVIQIGNMVSHLSNTFTIKKKGADGTRKQVVKIEPTSANKSASKKPGQAAKRRNDHRRKGK